MCGATEGTPATQTAITPFKDPTMTWRRGAKRLLVSLVVLVTCSGPPLLAAKRYARSSRRQGQATSRAQKPRKTQSQRPPKAPSQKPRNTQSQKPQKAPPQKPRNTQSQRPKKAPPQKSQRSRSQTPKGSRPYDPREPQRDHRNDQVLPPSQVYRLDASQSELQLDFKDTGFQWPQPGGPGTAVTITYSYSNLLDGQLIGISRDTAKQAVEEALTLWSEVAPLDFVEVADQGPLPSTEDVGYRAADGPQIRFGHHLLDGAEGGGLAHAYLPFSTKQGIAGDIHFDRDESWSGSGGGLFLETVLHEIGHALGLDHEVEIDAIMNPVIQLRFSGLSAGYLLDDDVDGIRSIYGAGSGSVIVLEDPVSEAPSDDPDDQDSIPERDPFGVLATLNPETQTLTILGDHEANSILIFSVPWFVAVVGTNNTRVNDQPGEVFFFSRRGTVICELGSGDDSLTTFQLRARTLQCDLGSGDDTLTLLLSSIRNLLASGSSGNDSLYRLGGRIKNFGHVGFELHK